ncbi:MAG: zinc ribbon domain-containing protein, partial [Chloroflexi bacterium]|nr:zinc ribbon domain-containing protein [Chloroflexota bacterium]
MTSSILKGFLTIPRLILWPIDKLMTFFHCLLLRATSGKLAIVYNPAYNAFWLPINLYLRGTSFVYRELFTPRPILVLITVPLILVFDIFRVILPNPDQSDKEKKARILESWPYSIDEVKNRPIKYGNLLTGNHCPQCRKPVADHWEVCQYCGEKLEGCPHCLKLISTSATQCSH